MSELNGEFLECLNEFLSFWGISSPINPTTNAGGFWFEDSETGKEYFLSFGECEG